MTSSSTVVPAGVEVLVQLVVASVVSTVVVVVVDEGVDQRPGSEVEVGDAELSSEQATALTVNTNASVASNNLRGLGGAVIRLIRQIRSDLATAAPLVREDPSPSPLS